MLAILRRSPLAKATIRHLSTGADQLTSPDLMKASAVGFCAGMCVGVVGWGGAQVIIPSLMHPAVLGLTQMQATGSSLVSLACSAVMSGSTYLAAGSADLVIAASLAPTAVIGARFGVRLAARLSGDMHALLFNGLSVLLIPSHFAVQRWRQRQPSVGCPNCPPATTAGLGLVGNATFGLFVGVATAARFEPPATHLHHKRPPPALLAWYQ